MGLALDMSPRSLEEIIYFASYVVTDPGDTPLEKKQLLSEKNTAATARSMAMRSKPVWVLKLLKASDRYRYRT